MRWNYNACWHSLNVGDPVVVVKNGAYHDTATLIDKRDSSLRELAVRLDGGLGERMEINNSFRSTRFVPAIAWLARQK